MPWSEVGENLDALNKTLTAIKLQTESLHGSLENLPSRLDKLETNVIDAARSMGEKTQAAPLAGDSNSVDDGLAQFFLNTSSLACNLLAYACVLAKQTNKELALSDFCIAIDSKLESYMSGFLACMDSMKLVERTNVVGKTRVYVIKSIHPLLERNTLEYTASFINWQYKDAKPEVYLRWTTAIKNVKELFA